MRPILLTVFFLFLVGCTDIDETLPKNDKELLIGAPSNLIFAFEEIGINFENIHDTKITFSFGSSGQIADQIEHGAPFDIFASANESFVDQLIDSNRLDGETKMIYGIGRIGISSNLPIKTLDELLSDEITKIAIANPEHAPYGKAAKEALISVGIWDEIKDKLVYSRNISEALTMLETKNVDASIIALSLKSEDFHFSIIDDSLHTPLRQSIAVNEDSPNKELATAFIDYLQSTEGKEILEKYGFVVPEGE